MQLDKKVLPEPIGPVNKNPLNNSVPSLETYLLLSIGTNIVFFIYVNIY